MPKSRILLSAFFLLAASALADTTETRYFSATMSPANESPALNNVTASGVTIITAVIRRNDAGTIVGGTVWFDVDYSFGAPATIQGLHIHDGAAGVNGPIRIDTQLNTSNTISAQGQGNILRAVEVTGGNPLTSLIDLVSNPSAHYVNLHTSANPGGVMRDQLQAIAAPPPNIVEGAMVSAASFALHPAPLAPGSIAALFGKYLNDGPPGGPTSFGLDGKLVNTLGGTQVLVNGIPAPLFFSFFNLVALQIPSEVAGASSATVQVTVGGRTSATRTIFLEPAAPGLFSVNANGQGAGAITHVDGSLVTSQNPAQPDEIIVVYLTGLGITSPPLATGAPAVQNTVPNPTVTIDGASATVHFAGRTPSLVGLDQINVQVPSGMRSASDLSVRVSMGARQSNTLTLAVGAAAAAPPPPPPPPPSDDPPPPGDGY